ncbi:MAG: phospholipase D-like domain-containing protein [Oligoflexia bacterium]|nr:phospholipase D-like domain-containing protein [Oligoflexia bacterium]
MAKKLRIVAYKIILNHIFLLLFLHVSLIPETTVLAKDNASSLKTIEDSSRITKPRPKILIFWASIGNGHLSASQGIADEVKKIYPEAEIILKDAREFQPLVRRKVVNHLYDFMTQRNPTGYDKWYQAHMKEGAEIASLGDLGIVDGQRPNAYLKYIKEVDPTMVISTQNHITEVMHRLRDQGELNKIPIAQVLTDYTDPVYFKRLGDKIEMSFVPHEKIREKFISYGMPENKVITSGIPVNPKARDTISPEAKREVYNSLGFTEKKPFVLITSGSAGVGDYSEMVKSIEKQANGKPVQIVAVTGRSKTNFQALNKLKSTVGSNIDLKVFPLVPQDQLYGYMKSADVVVGKTGGLTSTEIVAMGKKAVLLDINGGQETYNSKFFAENNLSLTTNRNDEIGTKVFQLLEDNELGEKIAKAQKEMRDMIHPESVADWALHQPAVPLSKSESIAIVPNEKRPLGARGPPVNEKVDARPKAAIFWDEAEVASVRLQLYRGSNKEVLASYYLHDGNKSGMIHFAELVQAARRQKAQGLKPSVKLMIDGWGPERWLDAKVKPEIIKALELEGVEVKIFNQVDLSTKKTYLNPNNFKRSHAKTLIIDGEYLIEGDRNVQNVNFRLQKTNGQSGKSYKSIEAVVKDENIANDARDFFIKQFDGPLATPIDTSKVSDEALKRAQRSINRYIKQLDEPGLAAIRDLVKLEDRLTPVKSIKYVHDVPGKDGYKLEGKGVANAIKEMVDTAYDEVRITSPYVRPVPDLEESLVEAAKKGKKVRLQTVAEHITDAPITIRAFENQAMALQERGLEVLQHQGPDFAHAKIVEAGRAMDGMGNPIGEKRSMITTHNMNPRSVYTDTETGIIIEDDAFANKVREFTDGLGSESIPFNKPKRSFSDSCKKKFLELILNVPVVNKQI